MREFLCLEIDSRQDDWNAIRTTLEMRHNRNKCLYAMVESTTASHPEETLTAASTPPELNCRGKTHHSKWLFSSRLRPFRFLGTFFFLYFRMHGLSRGCVFLFIRHSDFRVFLNCGILSTKERLDFPLFRPGMSSGHRSIELFLVHLMICCRYRRFLPPKVLNIF